MNKIDSIDIQIESIQYYTDFRFTSLTKEAQPDFINIENPVEGLSEQVYCR